VLTLEIKERNTKEKGAEGSIPAVFYGPKEKSTSISISRKDFAKLWKEAGESTVVTLSGAGDNKEALIHEVDLDPLSYEPRHVDFYVMEKGKKVKVSVPVEFVGVSPAIKELGGTLIKVTQDIEVEAMPKDLPQGLEVDISKIVDFSSNVTAADVALPQGVELVTAPGEVLASAAEAKEEEEETAPEVDLESIEVEKKGKQEEGSGEEEKKEDSGE
jgi:large subunit ribosomal protein L25|tara:strand:- start:40140 stop:40787 length:648 start_codon:yes stop_codon:yes gene_type:complete